MADQGLSPRTALRSLQRLMSDSPMCAIGPVPATCPAMSRWLCAASIDEQPTAQHEQACTNVGNRPPYDELSVCSRQLAHCVETHPRDDDCCATDDCSGLCDTGAPICSQGSGMIREPRRAAVVPTCKSKQHPARRVNLREQGSKRSRNLDGVRGCHRLSRDAIDVSSGDEIVEIVEIGDEGPPGPDDPSYAKFLENAARAESQNCVSVNWWHFRGTDVTAGWQAARGLASSRQILRWYVGVAKSPIGRMEGDKTNPNMTPHKHKGYHSIYPLIVTRKAAEIETAWIAHLTHLLGYSRRGNIGDGGEHALRNAWKFVYIVIRWNRSSMNSKELGDF